VSGIASSVANLLGGSRIPASAEPVTEPSPVRTGKPDARRNRKRPSKSTGKRDGRSRIIAALDPHEARTVNEWARAAGVTAHVVYDHLPGLLEAGIAIELRPLGHRMGKRYLRGRG
jgi:hypothetical protein